ncbi:hypothetical protein DCAR_0313023 [Daucus carota subsp. sativus]|uniref:Large ribosomal subunit protein uL15/eL18 domain-containing protein n=1 Tax=Daucus carota subsp. sativus TaxID=79200 RepID=A0A166BR71_DAUCS|nr:hypothetical protein DCAR_0313023 [Daucus carota subsp. sativus]
MAIDCLVLGAGQEVGKSCVVVNMNGKKIMFDCGKHMGHHDHQRYPDFSRISRTGDFDSSLTCIIIAHLEFNFCAFLILGPRHHFLRNLVLIEKLEQLDLKSVETVVDEKVEDKFGYFKVPGKDSGMKPIVVKAKLVSKIAEKKIEMGGAVVLTA